jgi:hypothetical protein
MKNTPATPESTTEVVVNDLPPMPDLFPAHFLNFPVEDIVDEFIKKTLQAFESSVPPEEIARLRKPRNTIEMCSVMNSLPEVQALKAKAQKRINKRAKAIMKSTIYSNPEPKRNFLNCDNSDLEAKFESELYEVVFNNIPHEELIRLALPENEEELVSVIHSLPE